MKFVIPGELADLNTYINAERSNRYAGAEIKRQMTNYITMLAKRLKTKISAPVRIHFKWYTKNLRVDPDNTAFAKKFILDGIVKAGILKNDSRRYIKGFTDEFDVDPEEPRVEVEIVECTIRN